MHMEFTATPSLQQQFIQFTRESEGLPFAALIDVATPLLELYDIAPQRLLTFPEAFMEDELELAAIVSFLCTARLIIAFTQLSEEEQASQRKKLLDLLTEPSSTPEETQEAERLIEAMKLRVQAIQQEYSIPPLDFFQLSCPSPTPAAELSAPSYPDLETLDLPEALALFAEPVLARFDLADDPEVFEHAMNLATAYWLLAQAPPDRHAYKIQQIQQTFGRTPEEAQYIEQEAYQMIERFHTLFSRTES